MSLGRSSTAANIAKLLNAIALTELNDLVAHRDGYRVRAVDLSHRPTDSKHTNLDQFPTRSIKTLRVALFQHSKITIKSRKLKGKGSGINAGS